MRTLSPPRPKPNRFARLDTLEGGSYRVQVTDKDDTTFYEVRPIPAAFGIAFRVEKLDGTVYYTNVGDPCDPHGSGTHCDCPSGCYRGECRHVRFLLALIRAGVLPVTLPEPDTLVELGRRFRPGYDD